MLKILPYIFALYTFVGCENSREYKEFIYGPANEWEMRMYLEENIPKLNIKDRLGIRRYVDGGQMIYDGGGCDIMLGYTLEDYLKIDTVTFDKPAELPVRPIAYGVDLDFNGKFSDDEILIDKKRDGLNGNEILKKDYQENKMRENQENYTNDLSNLV